jgi:hypothetical protein
MRAVVVLFFTGCVGSGYEALDRDGDGFSPLGGDSDDSFADIHPGAVETWYDGIDQDCAGTADTSCP